MALDGIRSSANTSTARRTSSSASSTSSTCEPAMRGSSYRLDSGYIPAAYRLTATSRLYNGYITAAT
jgi:hypothetical protein